MGSMAISLIFFTLVSSLVVEGRNLFIMDVTTEKVDSNIIVSGSVTGCGVRGIFTKINLVKLVSDMKEKAKADRKCSNASPVEATINGGSKIKSNLRQIQATIEKEAKKP